MTTSLLRPASLASILALTACFSPAPDVSAGDPAGSTSGALDGSSSGPNAPATSVDDGSGDAGGEVGPAPGDDASSGSPPDSTSGDDTDGPAQSPTSGEDSTGTTGDEEGSTGVADTSRVVFLLPYAGAPMNYGGLEGADAQCQASAAEAGLPGTFMAWLSAGAAAQVVDRFSIDGGPFVLVDGTEIAADWADLTDGTLAAPILLDAAGLEYDASALPERYVVTHTNADGTAAPGVTACSNFTADTIIEAQWGDASITDASWTQTGDSWACDNGFSGGPSLYCFEQ